MMRYCGLRQLRIIIIKALNRKMSRSFWGYIWD